MDEYGGGKHIARLIGAYIAEAIINIDAINEEDHVDIIHNESPLEQEAEVGSGIFRDFSKFVDENYGKGKSNMIQKLFNNKANKDSDIISKLNRCWKAYDTERYESKDYTDVPDN